MTEWVEGEYIEHRGIGGTDLKVRMEGGGGGVEGALHFLPSHFLGGKCVDNLLDETSAYRTWLFVFLHLVCTPQAQAQVATWYQACVHLCIHAHLAQVVI